MKQLKKLLSLLLVLSMLASFAVPASAETTEDSIAQYSTTINGSTVNYWLYTPANATDNMPLITFLHGGTGARNDVSELTDSSYTNLPYYLASDQVNVNAYVLMPHTTSTTGFDAETVIALTEYIIEEKNIDSTRVALTGHSMGGTSTWNIALADAGNVFKRYAPLSGSPSNTEDYVAIWKDLSIRTGYGSDEASGSVGTKTDTICEAILDAKADADITCTVMEGYGHKDVVQMYLNNTDVSGTSAVVAYAATTATNENGLMDWLSFAATPAGDSGNSGDDNTSDDDSDNDTTTVTYQYASASEAKKQYILVSNGYAIQNNDGTIAAVTVTVDGETVTVDSSVASTLLWTIDDEGNLTNDGYYLTRDGNKVAATGTEPNNKWSYASDDLSLTVGSNVYYAYYNTQNSAFRTVDDAGTAELKFYGVKTTSGGDSGSDDTTQEADGELFVDKHATLEDDGTYTITLEAYATGGVITNTNPVDICLILDTSGSMYQSFVPTYISPKDTTLGGMYSYVVDKDALYYHHDEETDVYREVSWATHTDTDGVTHYTWTCECGATCSGTADTTSDPTLYIVQTPKTDSDASKMTALKASVGDFITALGEQNSSFTDASLQSQLSIVTFGGSSIETVLDLTTVTEDNAETIIEENIDTLTASGNTPTYAGFTEAVSALAGSNRQKVYILFTDGLPTGTAGGSGFNPTDANNAIQAARTEKANGAIIYTIAIVSGADPAYTDTGIINMVMNGMSSNYPDATAYTSLGEGGNNGYYKVPEDAADLTKIFTEISNSYAATSITLNENAVLKDYLANGFVLTDNCTYEAKSVAYAGNNTWGADEDTTYTVTYDKDTGVVSVTGFDYADRCLIEAENDVPTSGAKLVVTIKGVEATDDAIGTGVYTNKSDSAVYDEEGHLAKAFPKPTTTIGEALFVLDYAKTTQLALDKFLQEYTMDGVTHLDTDGMNQFVSAALSLDEAYGDVVYNNGVLTYEPQTMNWDGYDSFYAFGKSDDTVVTDQEANENQNVWSKISVLPANNVYYEDTFVTEDDEGGRVGIVYSGTYENTWTQDGSEQNNIAEPENGTGNDNHGWIDALDGELTDTDGTATGATVSSTTKATATFTFTGTGVDIYSRTSPTSGTILVTIRGTTDEGTSVAKAKVIDTVSYSGNYYQVPTCTFDSSDGLTHGTYTVTINVTTAASSENRFTYYLDGIRVYNPLSNDQQVTDSTIQDAYGEEINAYFEEIRNDLLDANAFTAGTTEDAAVFIDFIDKDSDGEVEEDETGVTTTAVIGEYEDFGPKNEVYLQSKQMIVLGIDYQEGIHYYVGLKLLNGGDSDGDGTVDASSVEVGFYDGANTNSFTIAHSADMYYEVTPWTDGTNYYITIQNLSEGSALLCITKLKITNVPSATAEPLSFMMDISTEDALAVANLAYAAPVVESDVAADPEVDVTEPEEDVTEPVEPETEPTDPETPNVEIENPDDSAEEDKTEEVIEFIKKLFGMFSKWFG